MITTLWPAMTTMTGVTGQQSRPPPQTKRNNNGATMPTRRQETGRQ